MTKRGCDDYSSDDDSDSCGYDNITLCYPSATPDRDSSCHHDKTTPCYPTVTPTRRSNVKLAQKLLDDDALHCASCGFFFKSLVYSVQGTGIVCRDCLENNKWQGQRLRIYDALLEDLLILPCKNAGAGCKEVVLKPEDLKYHSVRCLYRPVICMAAFCTWFGQPDGMARHFEEVHRTDVIDEGTTFTLDFAQKAFVAAKLLIKNTEKCFLFIERDLYSHRVDYRAYRVEENRYRKVFVKHRCEIGANNATRYIDIEHLDMIDWGRVTNRISLAVLKEKPGDDYQLLFNVRVTKNKV